jgi:hypothetical protein
MKNRSFSGEFPNDQLLVFLRSLSRATSLSERFFSTLRRDVFGVAAVGSEVVVPWLQFLPQPWMASPVLPVPAAVVPRLASSPPAVRIELDSVSWSQLEQMFNMLKTWYGKSVSIQGRLANGSTFHLEFTPDPSAKELPPEIRKWVMENSSKEAVQQAEEDVKKRGKVELGAVIAKLKERHDRRSSPCPGLA